MRVPIDTIESLDEKNVWKLNEILLRFGSAINSIDFTLDTSTPFSAENMNVDIIDQTFGASGAEISAAHTLGRVPSGVILIKSNVPGATLYADNAVAWTSSQIYVKCSAAATVRFVVI